MKDDRYKLRFFFDLGCGVCFWTANELTEKKFGSYAVNTEQLLLSDNLRFKIYHLIAWYDTSIDWSDPAGASPWDKEESQRFYKEVKFVFEAAKKELGEKFYIINEV